jgi:hypothetical protein
MKSLLIAILVLVPLYAFAQDAKMPADAKKVIDKYDAAVEAAKKAYDATVAKARDQALKDLKPIQTAETKKGNLDAAVLVKAKIDELSSETMKSTPENELANPTSPYITEPKASMVAGKWKVIGPNWIWEFKVNGTTSRGNYTGKFVIENEKIIITWPAEVHTLRMPKLGTMEGTSSLGHQIKLEKTDEK